MARTPARTLRIDFRAARTPRARTRWRHTHLAWTCTTIDEWCSWTTPEKYDCGPDDNSTSHGQSKNTGGAYSLIITIEECASWVEKRWAFTLVFPGSSDQNWPLFTLYSGIPGIVLVKVRSFWWEHEACSVDDCGVFSAHWAWATQSPPNTLRRFTFLCFKYFMAPHNHVKPRWDTELQRDHEDSFITQQIE